MDSKLPIDMLDNVMQLAIEGCKAVANYMREVRTCVHIAINHRNTHLFLYCFLGLSYLISSLVGRFC